MTDWLTECNKSEENFKRKIACISYRSFEYGDNEMLKKNWLRTSVQRMNEWSERMDGKNRYTNALLAKPQHPQPSLCIGNPIDRTWKFARRMTSFYTENNMLFCARRRESAKLDTHVCEHCTLCEHWTQFTYTWCDSWNRMRNERTYGRRVNAASVIVVHSHGADIPQNEWTSNINWFFSFSTFQSI